MDARHPGLAQHQRDDEEPLAQGRGQRRMGSKGRRIVI